MKKLGLLAMPLMAVSLLASCNSGGGKDPVIYHTLKFVSETCYMKDDIGGQVSEKQFEAGETATFHLDPHEGYFLPLENQVHFKDTKTGEDFTGLHSYNPENGDISVKMTADVTIYAGNGIDSHYVSEEEFNNACSFKDVQYVQMTDTSTGGGTFNTLIELSPSVSHYLYESSSYNEIFIQKKGDGSYEKATRQSKKGPYDYVNVEASEFITPQGDDFNVLVHLQHAGLSYSSFTYDRNSGTYSVTFTPDVGSSVTETLKFENKKLISDIKTFSDSSASTSLYTYESKTPQYPEETGFKSIKRIEGTLINTDLPEGTMASAEYEYISDSLFTITNTIYTPEENGVVSTIKSKHYHQIEVKDNGYITDLDVAGTKDGEKYKLNGCDIYTYNEGGFLVEKQSFVNEEFMREYTDKHLEKIVNPVIVNASFSDSNSETFYQMYDYHYLFDENDNFTHELTYKMQILSDTYFETTEWGMRLYQIDEYQYNKNGQLISYYFAFFDVLSESSSIHGLDYTYDQYGMPLTREGSDRVDITFKNTTIKEFFENYDPYNTLLAEQEFDRSQVINGLSYFYKLATPGDYSKYTFETIGRPISETNPPPPVKIITLEDYYDYLINNDGIEERIYYNFKNWPYIVDKVEYQDMSDEITGIKSKNEKLKDKFGNTIKNLNYTYNSGEFVLNEGSQQTDFRYDNNGVLSSLMCPYENKGTFKSTKTEYCYTEADYHQNPNWAFHSAWHI